MSAREGIHVRLSGEERNALERAAARRNQSRSVVVRDLIMGLSINDDIKRAQADEIRAVRIALEAEIETLRRDISQLMLDLRSSLRDDLRNASIATIEAVTGKVVVAKRGESK